MPHSLDTIPLNAKRLLEEFCQVRRLTTQLTEPLDAADFEAQAMPDCSPTKWHLAHTTWFFESFILSAYLSGFKTFHPKFGYLFNSYYNALGDRHDRWERGLLTRPSLESVIAYRSHVEEHVIELLQSIAESQATNKLTNSQRLRVLELVELGCHHEQQHQELMLTDVLYLFSRNPLLPTYSPERSAKTPQPADTEWLPFPAEVYGIGQQSTDFAYDNEKPRHRVFLEEFSLASSPVTNGEYEEFVKAGGYQTSALWLDQGWRFIQENRQTAPLYWLGAPGEFQEFSLRGALPLDRNAPVCHLSLYEADAFARFAGGRLPTEAEWEVAARDHEVVGNFVDSGRLHPGGPPALQSSGSSPSRLFGDVWEWTASAYSPFPGYTPEAGAVGEYNGKFMCNQFVLRGGSCFSSKSHLRATYRNFFYAKDQWQVSGLRLAKS